MIAIELMVNRKDLESLEKMPKQMRMGLLKGMKKAMLFAEGEAKKSFNTAGHVKSRTGHLRRSIRSQVVDKGHVIVGSIGSNVIYSRIHEFGGTIVPRTKEWLRFVIDGRWVTTKKVVIPARPYLYPAIEENQRKIGMIIHKAIIDEVK